MINPDELEEEMEAHGKRIKELIMRSKQQEEDINKLMKQLEQVKEDIETADSDTISSESETSA